MKNYSLITGASSGIGEQFSWVFAENGHDLILVARGKEKLTELKKNIQNKHKVKVEVFDLDLTSMENCKNLYEETKKKSIFVDILVNNAGFGNYGYFHETDLEKEVNMINLNVTALTTLTKLYLKDMVEKGEGKILNVASVAAFFPGPLMAVYYATKSYVLGFSEALSEELADKGVTVCILCPGPVKTGFQDTAQLGNAKFLKFPTPCAREVAEYGYTSLRDGKVVAVHGTINKIQSELPRFFPRNWVSKVVKKVSQQE
ncbi:SDR family NAD(P)-dependent oxidoreductase [Patescibacteria group bacterium]